MWEPETRPIPVNSCFSLPWIDKILSTFLRCCRHLGICWTVVVNQKQQMARNLTRSSATAEG